MPGLLVIGLGNIASQDLLQRVFSARDERVALWSLCLSTVLYLTIAMIPVLIGIAGVACQPSHNRCRWYTGSCDRAVLPERLSAHGEIVLNPDGQLVRADDGCRVLEKNERNHIGILGFPRST